jgi:hypothetical protein
MVKGARPISSPVVGSREMISAAAAFAELFAPSGRLSRRKRVVVSMANSRAAKRRGQLTGRYYTTNSCLSYNAKSNVNQRGDSANAQAAAYEFIRRMDKNSVLESSVRAARGVGGRWLRMNTNYRANVRKSDFIYLTGL